jgi:hypothetical protein
MKQKELALIIFIIFVSGVASYFLSGMIFNSSEKKQQKVEVVQPITAQFSPPDNKYFNRNAINPTKLITIDDQSNTDPFKDGAN